MNYLALKNEILNDPNNLGYAPLVAAGTDQFVADILNDPSKGGTKNRGVVASFEVVNAIDPAEWVALTAQEKQRLQFITGAGEVDVSNNNIVNMFKAMFAAGTVTRAALIALALRPASRAEALGLAAVSNSDIAKALRGENV